MVTFIGNNKKAAETADKVENSIFSYRVSLFATPDIILTGKDSRFIGPKVAQFRNARKIHVQAIIPRHHQSVGSTVRRSMYFMDATHQILDKSNRRTIETVDWSDYASMCAMRLNAQVQRYDGFTPGRRRVVGRTPKWPIAKAGSPNLRDFTSANDSPSTQTRDLLLK